MKSRTEGIFMITLYIRPAEAIKKQGKRERPKVSDLLSNIKRSLNPYLRINIPVVIIVTPVLLTLYRKLVIITRPPCTIS